MGLVCFYIKSKYREPWIGCKVLRVLFPIYLSAWNQEYRMSALALCLSITLVGAVLATFDTGGPVVTLSYGSFQGNSTGALVEFLGMPYAAPPYASLLNFCFDDILMYNSLKVFDLLPLHCL